MPEKFNEFNPLTRHSERTIWKIIISLTFLESGAEVTRAFNFFNLIQLKITLGDSIKNRQQGDALLLEINRLRRDFSLDLHFSMNRIKRTEYTAT